jgi:hypothetical protein
MLQILCPCLDRCPEEALVRNPALARVVQKRLQELMGEQNIAVEVENAVIQTVIYSYVAVLVIIIMNLR